MTVTMPSDAAAELRDGRHARRDRNRDAVIAALVTFFDDGVAQPTAQQLAERAGISLRSVFRYFDDLDNLLEVAIPEFVTTRLDDFAFAAPPTGSSLEARVEAWVDHQVGLFPRYARIAVAVFGRARRHPRVLAQFANYRFAEAAQVAQLFAPELDALSDDERPIVLAALHSCALAETWLNLVDRHALGADGVRAVLRRLLWAALGRCADAPPQRASGAPT